MQSLRRSRRLFGTHSPHSCLACEEVTSQSAEARRGAVIVGGGGNFKVSENPSADAIAAWYEDGVLGNAAVDRYANEIDAAAAETGVNPNLLRTAIYLGNARGRCDAVSGPLNKPVYAQLGSLNDEFVIADCGMVYVFVCFECNEVKSIIQSN